MFTLEEILDVLNINERYQKRLQRAKTKVRSGK